MPPSRDGTFSRTAHRARVAAALRQRLAPNAALTPKVLAHAIGVSPDTVLSWAAGHSHPCSWRLTTLLLFFGPSFWRDVYGPVGDAMRQRFEEAKRGDLERLERDEAALQELEP